MKRKGEEQFHPSRDTRPNEYELPYGGNKGVSFSRGGYYEPEDLANAKSFWTAEGALEDPDVMREASHVMQPAQGRLFDPEKHEAANRHKLGRERFEAMDSGAEAMRTRDLQASRIPTSHLQSRPGLPDTQLTSFNDNHPWAGSGAAGWYRGPAQKNKADVTAMDPSTAASHGTFVHEAGHRRHLGELGVYADEVTHPRDRDADPLKEGVADAYADRYGGPEIQQVRQMGHDIEHSGRKFPSYQYTGYSTDSARALDRGWTTDDRALYAATRAHGSETGEQAFYEPRSRHGMEQQGLADYGGGDPTIDATLHSLLSAGPHAAQALRQTGLKDVGARAFRRHRDRELLTSGQSVQGSLFQQVHGVSQEGKLGHKTLGYISNPDAVTGGLEHKFDAMHQEMDTIEAKHPEAAMVWPVHMSHNQFGETPRSATDVNQTLGVSRFNAQKMGFI